MNMMDIERALRLSGMTSAANHLDIVHLGRVSRRKSTTKGGRKEDFATVERQICLKIRQPRWCST
jgi:hypothetical protein